MKQQKKLNKYLLILPAFFDIIENTFKNIALTLISASVTQMLRSSVVIFTTVMGLIFLNRKIYRHHFTSLIAIITGIFLIGYSSFSSEGSKSSNNVWGIVVLLIGQFFGASGYIIEEKFLSEFDDFDPILMAGIEGLWAVLMWIVILPILQMIPCDHAELCSNGKVENTLEAFEEYGLQPLNIVWSLAILFIFPFVCACGLSITKYGSAAQRTTIECARNVVVWIFFLFVPVYGHLIETFKWIQLIGFAILVFGVFLFNEILVIPFLGFNLYTREAIENREELMLEK